MYIKKRWGSIVCILKNKFKINLGGLKNVEGGFLNFLFIYLRKWINGLIVVYFIFFLECFLREW